MGFFSHIISESRRSLTPQNAGQTPIASTQYIESSHSVNPLNPVSQKTSDNYVANQTESTATAKYSVQNRHQTEAVSEDVDKASKTIQSNAERANSPTVLNPTAPNQSQARPSFLATIINTEKTSASPSDDLTDRPAEGTNNQRVENHFDSDHAQENNLSSSNSKQKTLNSNITATQGKPAKSEAGSIQTNIQTNIQTKTTKTAAANNSPNGLDRNSSPGATSAANNDQNIEKASANLVSKNATNSRPTSVNGNNQPAPSQATVVAQPAPSRNVSRHVAAQATQTNQSRAPSPSSQKPQVRIGQVNVIVEAPPAKAATKSGVRQHDISSRLFLRGL